MTPAEYLAPYPNRIRQLIARCKMACKSLSDEKFNTAVKGMPWSPAQILEHMMMANRAYLPILKKLIRDGEQGKSKLRHTWFGKMLMRAAGPGGSAPSPKVVSPAAKRYSKEVLREWADQHEEIASLAASASGIDLVKTRFRNPFVRLFRMNLYDAFEVILQHGERHVSQIESVALPPATE